MERGVERRADRAADTGAAERGREREREKERKKERAETEREKERKRERRDSGERAEGVSGSECTAADEVPGVRSVETRRWHLCAEAGFTAQETISYAPVELSAPGKLRWGERGRVELSEATC